MRSRQEITLLEKPGGIDVEVWGIYFYIKIIIEICTVFLLERKCQEPL